MVVGFKSTYSISAYHHLNQFSTNGKVYSKQPYATHLNCEFVFFQWYGVLNTTLCDSPKL
jgi:hypothetical protein